MSNFRFQLDIDRLGELLKSDPSLIETKEYKDGSKHRLVKFDILERKQPSDRGATHYIKADLYHKKELNGVNYYLADCYPIHFGKKPGGEQQEQNSAPAPAPAPTPTDQLPF